MFKASVYQFFIFLSFTFNAVAQERSDVNAADIFLIENTINLSTPVAGSAHLLGQTIYITAPIAGPLYASGQSITLSTPVATVGDTAHLLAQTITIGSAIKGALYATGQSVLINGPVSKNVQIAGERIQVKGQIDGHLRAFGEHIELHAPIFGSAYVRGETVVIASVIHQDLDIKAQKIEFKEGAELLGKLRLSETTELSGPALTTLISEDRVTMTPAPTALFERGKPVPPNLWLLQQVGFILKIGVLMILFGLFMPHRIFENSETLKARPFNTGWNGVLAFAMILGLMLVFALTGVGVILMPFFLLAAAIAAGFGGITAGYLLGKIALENISGFAPDQRSDQLKAAGLATALLFILSLVPFLNYLAFLILACLGMGLTIWPQIKRMLRLAP